MHGKTSTKIDGDHANDMFMVVPPNDGIMVGSHPIKDFKDVQFDDRKFGIPPHATMGRPIE